MLQKRPDSPLDAHLLTTRFGAFRRPFSRFDPTPPRSDSQIRRRPSVRGQRRPKNEKSAEKRCARLESVRRSIWGSPSANMDQLGPEIRSDQAEAWPKIGPISVSIGTDSVEAAAGRRALPREACREWLRGGARAMSWCRPAPGGSAAASAAATPAARALGERVAGARSHGGAAAWSGRAPAAKGFAVDHAGLQRGRQPAGAGAPSVRVQHRSGRRVRYLVRSQRCGTIAVQIFGLQAEVCLCTSIQLPSTWPTVDRIRADLGRT